VTFHALRHSFATHLLEKGVDIKYIKDLLGHFDIKTTERYLHVAREKLVEIKSPLDYLDVDI
jgi:integrase/recombinase XerD